MDARAKKLEEELNKLIQAAVDKVDKSDFLTTQYNLGYVYGVRDALRVIITSLEKDDEWKD